MSVSEGKLSMKAGKGEKHTVILKTQAMRGSTLPIRIMSVSSPPPAIISNMRRNNWKDLINLIHDFALLLIGRITDVRPVGTSCALQPNIDS